MTVNDSCVFSMAGKFHRTEDLKSFLGTEKHKLQKNLAAERKRPLGQSVSFKEEDDVVVFAAKETVPNEMFVNEAAQCLLCYYDLKPSPDSCNSQPAESMTADFDWGERGGDCCPNVWKDPGILDYFVAARRLG